jgi:hypothetical protein
MNNKKENKVSFKVPIVSLLLEVERVIFKTSASGEYRVRDAEYCEALQNNTTLPE